MISADLTEKCFHSKASKLAYPLSLKKLTHELEKNWFKYFSFIFVDKTITSIWVRKTKKYW